MVFCLSTLPPACCLTERYDEYCRRVELAAVSTPLLSHPSLPSLFSFHSPTPLLLSHTSLPLSFHDSAPQRHSHLFLSLFLFLTSFLFLSHPTAECHRIRGRASLLCVWMCNKLVIRRCKAKDCSTDLFISCHSSVMKR